MKRFVIILIFAISYCSAQNETAYYPLKHSFIFGTQGLLSFTGFNGLLCYKQQKNDHTAFRIGIDLSGYYDSKNSKDTSSITERSSTKFEYDKNAECDFIPQVISYIFSRKRIHLFSAIGPYISISYRYNSIMMDTVDSRK